VSRCRRRHRDLPVIALLAVEAVCADLGKGAVRKPSAGDPGMRWTYGLVLTGTGQKNRRNTSSIASRSTFAGSKPLTSSTYPSNHSDRRSCSGSDGSARVASSIW
jgi:hypothetical protein